MNVLLKTSLLALLISPVCFSQDPAPILKASWERATLKAPKGEAAPTGPAKSMVPDNRYFQRKARENRTDNPMDPYDASVEGRSAAMDKAVQESRTAKVVDVAGYQYAASVRNDSGRGMIEVVFWEYRFTEIARPSNVVRRQFLCGVKLKKGETQELMAFSKQGPSDVIDAASLSNSTGKLFQEEVYVNRVEFADGSILQRQDWHFNDVKESVKLVTSAPWGREQCRAL